MAEVYWEMEGEEGLIHITLSPREAQRLASVIANHENGEAQYGIARRLVKLGVDWEKDPQRVDIKARTGKPAPGVSAIDERSKYFYGK